MLRKFIQLQALCLFCLVFGLASAIKNAISHVEGMTNSPLSPSLSSFFPILRAIFNLSFWPKETHCNVQSIKCETNIDVMPTNVQTFRVYSEAYSGLYSELYSVLYSDWQL